MKLKNFYNPFCIEPSSIERTRKNLEKYRRDWLKKRPIHVSLEEFKLLDSEETYLVTHNSYEYNLLFIPKKNSKRLYISLCGGGRKNKIYPLFTRWKYFNYLNANFLCIEDPMYKLYPEIYDAMWYYGTQEHWLISDVSEIIEKIKNQLNLSNRDIVFFGSSGGGTASLYLANLFEDSAAYALNPQYDLSSWNFDLYNFFKQSLNIDLSCDDSFKFRNNIKLTSKRSRYFLCENFLSEKDRNQFIPFFERNNFPLKYGISQHNNIITWIHATNGTKIHSSNPEKLEFLLLDYLNEELKNNECISDIENFSCFFNEYLNIKYISEIYKEKSKKLCQMILESIFNKLSNYFCFENVDFKNIDDSICLYLSDCKECHYKISLGNEAITTYLILVRDRGVS